MRAADAVFIGTLRSHGTVRATYMVDSIQRPRDTSAPSLATGRAPALVRGSLVAVHYFADTAQFLHDGRRYSVAVFVNNGAYWSDVHTADRPCSGGTQYANGKLIDTSYWSRPWVRVTVFAILGAVGVAAIVLTRSLRRRARRRARFLRTGTYG